MGAGVSVGRRKRVVVDGDPGWSGKKECGARGMFRAVGDN